MICSIPEDVRVEIKRCISNFGDSKNCEFDACIVTCACVEADRQRQAVAAVQAFEQLQDHSPDLGPRERLEWLSALAFFQQVHQIIPRWDAHAVSSRSADGHCTKSSCKLLCKCVETRAALMSSVVLHCYDSRLADPQESCHIPAVLMLALLKGTYSRCSRSIHQ